MGIKMYVFEGVDFIFAIDLAHKPKISYREIKLMYLLVTNFDRKKMKKLLF